MIHSLALTTLIVLAPSSLGQMAPDVIVRTLAGSSPSGTLLAIEKDFAVKLSGKTPFTFAGPDIVSLRQVRIPHPTRCAPPYLQLTTGDCVPLAMPLNLRLEDETLHASLAAPVAQADYSVPHAAVALIALSATDELHGKREGDVIVLKNGDRLSGKIIVLDGQKGLTVMSAGRLEMIPLERVAQVAFDPEFLARPRPKSLYADVVLAGGTRLVATGLKTEPGSQLTATSLLGQRFSFAASHLAAVRMRQGKTTYLDERKPKSFTMTPFLDVAWPLSTGRSLFDRPLKLGGDFHPLGLAMHSQSKATYDVLPGENAFEAWVGVDPDAGAQAAVNIDVQLDGKSVPGIARLLKAGDEPAFLRVDLHGAKTLTLVTDFGPRGELHGHAIWADARMLKK